MRLMLIIPLILFACLVDAQNAMPVGRIVDENTSVIIIPKIMNEKEIRLLLKEKNNSGIDKLAAKSKLFKNFRPVGFASIPAGLFGAMFLSARKVSYNDGAFSDKITRAAGISLFALGTICLSSGVYFNLSYKKNYKKAILKYNELYN